MMEIADIEEIFDYAKDNNWLSSIFYISIKQFHLSRIYSSKKNKRRQQSELVFSESECQRNMSNGHWSAIV